MYQKWCVYFQREIPLKLREIPLNSAHRMMCPYKMLEGQQTNISGTILFTNSPTSNQKNNYEKIDKCIRTASTFPPFSYDSVMVHLSVVDYIVNSLYKSLSNRAKVLAEFPIDSFVHRIRCAAQFPTEQSFSNFASENEWRFSFGSSI